jgi:hypothetical protein
MAAKVYAERVIFRDGRAEIASNLTVHKVGGHSRGLQTVRVLTRRGCVVLAPTRRASMSISSRAGHFPVLESVSDMLEGFNTMRRLASSPGHIIPGHDPLVIARYPGANPGGARHCTARCQSGARVKDACSRCLGWNARSPRWIVRSNGCTSTRPNCWPCSTDPRSHCTPTVLSATMPRDRRSPDALVRERAAIRVSS